MDESQEPLTPEELERQKPHLLPDREAMSLVDPLPGPPPDTDALFPTDLGPKGAA